MKNHFLLLYITLIVLCSSCAYKTTGWLSNYTPGSDKASFSYFNGKNTDTISLSAGDVLRLSYKVKVTKGRLSIYVQNGRNLVWHTDVSTIVDSTINLTAIKSGRYKITIEGQQAAGSFELSYKNLKNKKVQVTINKNIELFGLMLQLDNGPDVINSKDSVTIDNKRVPIPLWYQKTVDNYRRYKKFDSCAMMKLYRDNQAKGFYNDFFIGFLLEVDEVPFAKINAGTNNDTLLAFSPTGDLEEAKRNAGTFLTMLNDFYRQVNFDRYLNDNAVYYTQMKINVEKSLPKENFIPVMEGFYQKQFKGYYLVPSLNVPSGMGFGKMNKKTQTVYNTFGPFTLQSFNKANPDVGFDRPDHIRNLSVHEFGHSFVNPAINQIPDTLIRSTTFLYKPISETMHKFSYPSWKICLYEHFVRAGEVLIARRLGDTATANKTLNDNLKSGFIYLPAIVTELEKYAENKERYPSYGTFVPLVLEKLKQTKNL
jgi:hypothetical protein